MEKLDVKLTQEEIKWLLVTLRKIDFFSKASFENIDKIISSFSKYKYAKGEVILKEKKPGVALYVIRSGSCLVYKKKWLFGKKEIAILKSGDFFGEMSLILDELTSATVKSLEPAEIYVYLKSDFLSYLSQNQQLKDEITAIAQRRKYENEFLKH